MCHDPPLWMYWLTWNTYTYVLLTRGHPFKTSTNFLRFLIPPFALSATVLGNPVTLAIDQSRPLRMLRSRVNHELQMSQVLDLQLTAIDKPRPSPLNGWSPISKSTQRLVTNVLWYSLVTIIIGCGIFWGECKQEQCAHVLTVHITSMHTYY